MVKKKKLRVFEAFAGIGAQNSAFKRLGINYEIVGVSEWFIDAIDCYDAIQNKKKPKLDETSLEEKIDYLKKFTFSRDSVRPIADITKLGEEKISKLYNANKRIKNFGSIVDIANGVVKIPDFDLLTYSFPCQDLSTGGKTEGMKKGADTRSGLLWEIEKILIVLYKEKRLPEYLLMENVKAILAPSNKDDLEEWLNFLESIGYKNSDQMVLDATKFGIPQARKRCFIVSHLNTKIDITADKIETNKPMNCHDFIMEDYSNKIYKLEADAASLFPTMSRKEMWRINKREPINKDTIIHTITCNMDRSNTAAMIEYRLCPDKEFRLLTIREAFLLMGFTNDDYEASILTELSYRKMNKLIGNSIVVDVLIEIFRYLFKGRYDK